MKINVFEKICSIYGGSYEYEIYNKTNRVFLTWNTGKYILFTDDLKKIERKAKKEGFILLHISSRHDYIILDFVKRETINMDK